VDRRDNVILNEDNFTPTKPLLRRVSDAVVNTRDRLAVLVGHAIDITLERTGSHDEAAARTVGQRNLSEYLPLPRLPGADLLLAELDDLIGRGSGFADYARVDGDAERLAGTGAADDRLVERFGHRLDDQVDDRRFEACQRHRVSKQADRDLALQAVVRELDARVGLDFLAVGRRVL